jgi:hypothetical protein
LRGLVCGALWLLVGSGMVAAEPQDTDLERQVLLVVDRPNDPLIERIQAEVVALGLKTITQPSAGPLEEDARTQHAVAAIRVLPSRKGVEVWMADATTGRTLARQLVVDERPQGPDYGLVALQTTEILRTGIFGKGNGIEKPKDPTPPPPPPPLPEPPPVAYTPAQWTNRTSVSAGMGSLSSLGGTGTSLVACLSFEQTVWQRLGIALDAALPVLRANLSGPGGSAHVGAYLMGLALFVRLQPPDARWFLTTGAGGSVVHIRSEGHTETEDQSLAGASSNGLVGAAYARIHVGWQPAPWTRIGLAAVAGASFPRITVRFAGTQTATWGGLFVAGLAMVGVQW